MKMSLSRHLTTIICAVFIATGAVSGEGVKKAVGDQVSFHLDKLPVVSSITSIIWKHKNTDGVVVKAIEWDEGEIIIPNPRFKGITTVDEKTGQITITNLKVEHSGVYTTDINSKEQGQTFTLTVKERVPKPVIKTEKSDVNSDVAYLKCEYSEKITWKNSDGKTLNGTDLKNQDLTVKKSGKPDLFYTCTLSNDVSEVTSDGVYEKDLFPEKSNVPVIVGGIIGVIIIIIIILGLLYLLLESARNFVNNLCPCIEGRLNCFSKTGNGDIEAKTEKADELETLNDTAVLPENNGAELTGVKAKPESDPVYENEGGQQEEKQ